MIVNRFSMYLPRVAPMRRAAPSVHQAAEERYHFVLGDFACRNAGHERFCLGRVIDVDVVHAQEHERGVRARSLVPVHERVVAHDVEQVRCRHRGEIRVQVLAGERLTGLRDGRFEQGEIDDALSSAVPRDLVVVNPKHGRVGMFRRVLPPGTPILNWGCVNRAGEPVTSSASRGQSPSTLTKCREPSV